MQLLLYILLRVLEVLENSLEVLVTAGVFQFILELSQFVALLHFKCLLELFFLKLTLSFVIGQVLFKLVLDFLNNIVHLVLFLSLVVAKLSLHLVKLLRKLLAFLAPGVKTTGQKLILTGFILLHHDFDSLNLVLEFPNKTFDFFT